MPPGIWSGGERRSIDRIYNRLKARHQEEQPAHCDVWDYPRILPSKAYEKYEKDSGVYMPDVPELISCPVNVKATYYMATRRRVDLTNLHEALHDILVHYGILADDNSNIIVSTDGSRVHVDKWHPRTEVEITPIE